ncbi:hypothetical protein [Streptantibioticus silvisoli]|uniref:Integral membrane protein n=1 Tax=Streptantibioticus silvisoli TaxID=2705255 RepID=A0ABT6W7I3_9ACTN|nr:hypothetical protein [Streptantibioticus silvisoli]MDI5966274.1 hypothetical protein [Streptantibioticus silvisoli]
MSVAEGMPQDAAEEDAVRRQAGTAPGDAAGGPAGGTAAADEDALYVLTATLLTPGRFPSVLGDDYPAACAALRLVPRADGYGLVLGQDGLGARWTVVTSDTALVAVAVATWDCGMEYDLSPGERTIVASLPGWPLELAVAAPGLPAPHDPAGADEGPALTPPDTSVWGPAQRRLGADEIALRWRTWRAEIDDAQDFTARPSTGAGADAGGAGGGIEGHRHPGVRRALAEARGYVGSPPPPGRVRSSFAEGDARSLRADGPGWSMVARTDDIAFFLLDDAPGEVVPVGRGAELPRLLAALDQLAVRTDA